MEIYLVQHGEAKSESEDPERPLTDKGRHEVESVARSVAGRDIRVSRILHSGRLRAKQTAEGFAMYLEPPQGIIEQEGLGPSDDPQRAKQLISQATEPLMIVGHLPHLSRLASLLILENSEAEVVKFRMAGVVCLGKIDNAWLVSSALVPEIVLMLEG